MEDKPIAVNRKAYYDYAIEGSYEAGLVLTGTEIKSIRDGKVNLREGFARIENGEAWLYGVHIAPYEPGNRYNVEPTRRRKLLLHRKQIEELGGKAKAKGYTLIPTRLYIKNHVAKVQIGLAKGKKQFDKRETIAKRDAARDLDRALREGSKSRASSSRRRYDGD